MFQLNLKDNVEFKGELFKKNYKLWFFLKY
jgi:hypothetical protein